VKRTEPTRSLLQGMPYVNAASTDIRARFEAMKADLQKSSRKTSKTPLRIANAK
jgi:hypothetical protein